MKGTYPRSVLLTFSAAMLLSGCGKKEEAPPPAPPVVLVTDVTQADAPVFTKAIATLNGSTNTEIHSQVSGYLLQQAYQEGSAVKAGDLLFQIDPKPFQADLDKAQATLANRQAQLLRSKQDLDRYTALVKSGAVSQQEYQTKVQNNLSAQADVDAARASVVTAQINLGHTKITSPIPGVAGAAIPGVGDLIGPGMTLTTVSTVDPIQAEFTLPEQFYLDNAERIAKVSTVPLQDRPESIELVLADGTPYPRKGRFYYVNRQIQTSTGAITAYALFPNPDRVLRPGQYVKVRGITQRISGAVLVPQRCVTQLQGTSQVMVVKPDNTVEARAVTTGDLDGPLWIVTSGLKPGERVIVEGIQKVRQGALVTPEPYVAPASEQPPSNP
ncbi:MAG TPA: efflux RND transporter periplasmic adaptor subunit [Candidatus Methylacidiphilales bacterium]|jgi:membrane fusion protein (multidrug efflux system)|nr:efflux RND transporter periplasmic adaptor subunit [Candidatus Methylacidiphilales bacterium]